MSAILYILKNGLFRYIVANILHDNDIIIIIIISEHSNPCTGLFGSRGFQEVENPRFQDSRHMKVLRLSGLGTGRLYPPEKIPGTHFCQRLSRPQGHRVAEWIMSMKNSNEPIGNRTSDLPACSAVPHPNAPPRAR